MRITNIALLLLLPFAAEAVHIQVAADKGKKKDGPKKDEKEATGDATEPEQEKEASESIRWQSILDDLWKAANTNGDNIIDEKELPKLYKIAGIIPYTYCTADHVEVAVQALGSYVDDKEYGVTKSDLEVFLD